MISTQPAESVDLQFLICGPMVVSFCRPLLYPGSDA